jgi:serine/threonine protein kinase
MPLQPDSLLRERYRIVGELGHGGMGAVYRGHDENLGVDVAIKENLFVSPESERQFRREAGLLASLRHSNLPRVTDHFVIPGQGQYLVMDFVAGDDAKTLLDRGALAEREVVCWGREILEALAYLHSRPQPILHRDIKPGNIKITPEGRAVLVDFGLAKVHDTSQSTTVGAKAFTPGFAPPEQYGLGRTDPRTDIYALGATLYNLLTGQMPADSLERAMGQKTLTPIRDLNPAVSPRTAQAVERALSIKPEERFAAAADFAAALPPLDEFTLRANAESTVAKPEPAQPEAAPVAPARRSSAPLVAGAVVVLALAGVGGGLWATGAFNPATPTVAPSVTPAPPTSTLAEVVALPSSTPTPTSPPPTATPPPTETATPSPTPTVTLTVPPTATPRGGGPGQIAFVSERVQGVPQIFVLDLNNPERDRDLKPLTSLADGACQPAWSPDGQKLLFISPCPGKKETYPGAIIYLMNADGTDVQPLIHQVGGVFEPAWSQIGIAYTYLTGGRPQLWLTDPGGGAGRILSKGTSADSHGSWSPDGERLVFRNTTRGGRPTLYWMTKDGNFAGNEGQPRSQPEQVTRDLDAAQPDWSADGRSVAFVSSNRIYVVEWNKRGFDAQNITGSTGPNEDPDWSPDGRWIAFESWRQSANHDIWIMTANGGQPVAITQDSAWDYQPAWRP